MKMRVLNVFMGFGVEVTCLPDRVRLALLIDLSFSCGYRIASFLRALLFLSAMLSICQTYHFQFS